jgi:hypothetical protein
MEIYHHGVKKGGLEWKGYFCGKKTLPPSLLLPRLTTQGGVVYLTCNIILLFKKDSKIGGIFDFFLMRVYLL